MRARSLVTYRVQCSSFFPSTLLWRVVLSSFFFFFFQAEDGIRDGHVTGVQTCALPISRVHIEQAGKLGLGDNTELIRVVRYHDGLLSILKGDFEKAQETLGSLSYEGLKSEELIISLGLAILRIGMTPKEITIDYPDRALIRRAGLAEHFAAEKNMSDAQREYDMVVRD